MASGVFTNANTESARGAALASFDRFLQKHQVARANVHELIDQDPTGEALASTIDQYALYLVAVDGTRGKRLEQSTVTQYFRTVKNWLLDQHPGQEAPSRRRLAKSANSIKNSFKNACQNGGSRQAVACKKADLQGMIDVIYQTAGEEVDYHDAALLILMWYLLGRSSDMAFLSKGNVTVTPSGSITLRFGRVKTGVEQGLALYGDKEFLSCPIHALAMAAVVERVPSDIIFRHLPKTISDQDERPEYPDDLLLSEVFQQQIERAAVSQGTIRSAPSIHSYVNRCLRRIVELAKYSQRPFNPTLTSHSFRRGGAQAANASSKISLQWILDRGGWQLSSLNRGFIYIFNTTTEDQQVAKVLSGYDPEQPVWQPRLDELDATSRTQIGIVQTELFGSSIQPDMREFSFKPEVLDVFMAHLLFHYPDVCERLPRSRYQVAVDRALATCGYTRADMLGWSLALRHKELGSRTRQGDASQVSAAVHPPTQESKLEVLLGQHMEMMHALLKQNAALETRLNAIENRLSKSTPLTDMDSPPSAVAAAIQPTVKRRRAAPMTLTDVWMLWYTSRPPLYDSKSDVSKQRFSDFKLVVAYMRLFLPNGYSLGSGGGGLSEIRLLGAEAEAEALRRHYLHSGRRNGHAAAAYGTVLKSLKELHAMGAFDVLLAELIARIDSGAVTDPTPDHLLLPTQK